MQRHKCVIRTFILSEDYLSTGDLACVRIGLQKNCILYISVRQLAVVGRLWSFRLEGIIQLDCIWE